jgi:hypothetical protein
MSSGGRGRRFKSGHPDQFIPSTPVERALPGIGSGLQTTKFEVRLFKSDLL